MARVIPADFNKCLGQPIVISRDQEDVVSVVHGLQPLRSGAVLLIFSDDSRMAIVPERWTFFRQETKYKGKVVSTSLVSIHHRKNLQLRVGVN